MKYKTRKALVIIALAIGTLMTSAFTFENTIPIEAKPALNQIVPYWENADDAKLNLSFSSGVANCTLNVLGKQDVSKITADMRLYRINSNGSYSSVASWRSITAYGSSLKATRSSGITPGYTYRLEADIKVHNSSNVEDISLYKEGYYR
jgi:hypothetical protein